MGLGERLGSWPVYRELTDGIGLVAGRRPGAAHPEDRTKDRGR
jgi:hypothetical protein